MEKKYKLSVFALIFIAILGLGVVSAFGFGNGMGFMNPPLTDEEKLEMENEHEAVQEAISSNDYSTWKNLMQARITKMQAQINEEQFNIMRQHNEERAEFRELMEQARESGDFSKIQELKEQFDIGSNGLKKGMNQGNKGNMQNCQIN